jgi:hypothetical protein
VLAFEAILSASPEFFERGSSEERAARLRKWATAQVDWAVERYGRHRIASLVLHLDEKTPHMHLVVLPLEVKSDKRRKDPTKVRWSLAGRTISGLGKFGQAQDAYGAAMSGFGLVRGIKGSGRKHEPVRSSLRGWASGRNERDAGAVERQRVTAELDAAAKGAAEAQRSIDDEKRRLAEEREQFDRELRAISVEKVELARAAAKARRGKQEVASALLWQRCGGGWSGVGSGCGRSSLRRKSSTSGPRP